MTEIADFAYEELGDTDSSAAINVDARAARNQKAAESLTSSTELLARLRERIAASKLGDVPEPTAAELEAIEVAPLVESELEVESLAPDAGELAVVESVEIHEVIAETPDPEVIDAAEEVPEEPEPKITPKPKAQTRTRADAKYDKERKASQRRLDDDEQDLVRVYLTDIGQFPLLTKEDEVELAQAYEAGLAAKQRLDGVDIKTISPSERRDLRRAIRAGEEAESKFVCSNLRLVVSIAKNYRASGLPLLDLIQEGNLGLMHAVEKYDWRKGFKFSTYSTWWIRQAITRGIANTGATVRLPVHAGAEAVRLKKAREKLRLEKQRKASAGIELEGGTTEPTIIELASELDLTPKKVLQVIQDSRTGSMLSLDEPLREDGDAELVDVVGDPTSLDAIEATEKEIVYGDAIAKMEEVLNAREFEVLRMRFLEDGIRTHEEVGKLLHLKREIVRQTEARAMAKLRHPTLRHVMGGAHFMMKDS